MASVIEGDVRARRGRLVEYARLVDLGVFAGARLDPLDGSLVVREPSGSSRAATVACIHRGGDGRAEAAAAG